MEIERTLQRTGRDMESAAADIAKRLPGRRSILFAHGVEVIPIKTATLRPPTTRIATSLGTLMATT